MFYQEYSLDQLNSFVEVVAGRAAAAGVDSTVGVGYSDAGTYVDLELSSGDAGAAAALVEGIPDSAIRINLKEQLSLSADSAPSTGHGTSGQKAGLQIGSYDIDSGELCTWGVNGHTTSNYYAITAGHCLTPMSGVTSGNWYGGSGDPYFEVYQNASKFATNLTPGETFVVFHYGDETDVGRFSTSYADDNCYHAGTDACYRIKVRTSLGTADVGETMCASLGKTGAYSCGALLGYSTVTASGNTFTNLMRSSIDTVLGDSGSGSVSGDSLGFFDGILIIQGYSGSMPTYSYWFQAYYMLNNLGGAHLNCYASGNLGTTCPVANR